MSKEQVVTKSVCSNAAMRRAVRRLGQLYDDGFDSLGIKATQFGLLHQVAQLGEPSLRELAGDLVMDLSALGHTLKPLLRDGLVELLPDARDGRVKRVRLTALGRAKHEAGAAIWLGVHGRFEALFGAERARELREALDWIASQDFADRFNAIRQPANGG